MPVLQTGDPGAIPGGSTSISNCRTGPVVQWRRHLAYNQKTMVRFHPGPLERRFSKPPLARCDAGLAARLSISPTRVRFPSASLGIAAAGCCATWLRAGVTSANGRQPDTVGRAALLTRASARGDVGSNPTPSASTITPRPDGETDDHASLRTRGSRFESWSGCLDNAAIAARARQRMLRA